MRIDGMKLKKLIRDRGLSRAELAEHIPIGRDQISRWCSERSSISDRALDRLLEVLGVEITALLPDPPRDPSADGILRVWESLDEDGRKRALRVLRTIRKQSNEPDDDQEILTHYRQLAGRGSGGPADFVSAVTLSLASGGDLDAAIEASKVFCRIRQRESRTSGPPQRKVGGDR